MSTWWSTPVITGGGVTAGIDFALRVAAEVAGEEVARATQLAIEYEPRPPFDSGHPRRADPVLVAKTVKRAEAQQAERRAQVENAAAALRKKAIPSPGWDIRPDDSVR